MARATGVFRPLSIVDRVLAALVRVTAWLALPLSLLLFLQWPLREIVQAYSREANRAAPAPAQRGRCQHAFCRRDGVALPLRSRHSKERNAMGQWLELTSSDGFTLSAYRADPEGRARGGVVVVQEIFGVNSHIRSVCDGYARDGYVAIAPALFDRIEGNNQTAHGAPSGGRAAHHTIELGYSEQDIARGRELKGASNTDKALADVAAAREAIKSAGKVGIVGYCWGGYIAWMAAARLTGFACAVPYYGGGMVEAKNEQPKCPVLAHFGKKDHAIPLEGAQQLAAEHPEAQMFFYDAGHGFNCDQRGSFDAAAARLARERTLEFFRQHIG